MNKFWQIRAQSDNEAEVLIYGEIGTDDYWSDITAKDFAKELKNIGDIKKLSIRINSPGGDVFAAQAIYSMLKRHSAQKKVFIDGLAASAASIIAMAGDKLVMPFNSMLMIHNPWSWGSGDSGDFRQLADNLDKVRETMLNVYEKKTGLSNDEIKALLDAETWMTAQDALDMGFADEIEGAIEIAACASTITTTSKKYFKRIPEALLGRRKGEDKPMEITASVLASKYPEIYDQIKKEGYDEGIKTERKRIQDIEDLGCTDIELVNKAKYETGESVAEVAVKILKAQSQKKTERLLELEKDSEPLKKITNGSGKEKKEEKEEAVKNSLKNAFKGRKK